MVSALPKPLRKRPVRLAPTLLMSAAAITILLSQTVKDVHAACNNNYSGKTLVARWQPIDTTNDWTDSANISSGENARAGILVSPDGVMADAGCVSSRVEDASGNVIRNFSSDTGFRTYYTGTYYIYTSYIGSGSPTIEDGASLTVVNAVPTATPTPTPIPCPYNSLQARVQVSLDGGGSYKDWKQVLNISQFQTDFVKGAAFKDGSGDLADLNYLGDMVVSLEFNSSELGSNPSMLSVSGVGGYSLVARGVGLCSGLGSDTATLNVAYCPYKEISVDSLRGRSGDSWLPDITINKKDVKAGTVQSGVYYNNDDGTGNHWTDLDNLTFTIQKPPASGETLDFNNYRYLFGDPRQAYSRYRIPPTWYSSGVYLNYPGTYILKATAKNDGATPPDSATNSCGDYPPEAAGSIQVINCSFDSTVGGFQKVTQPPPVWVGSLNTPSGSTVKSGGFHDRDLLSIDPNIQDVSTITPRNQVSLKITDSANTVNQNLDQGAPFTFVLPEGTDSDAYTLFVTTPDNDKPGCPDSLNPANPACFENGIGCQASATLTIGATGAPLNACAQTLNKIDCCPLLTGNGLLKDLADALKNFQDAVGAKAADFLTSALQFRMTAAVDQVKFTSDRVKHANWLFGTKIYDSSTGEVTIDAGTFLKLAPVNELQRLGLETDVQKIGERLRQVTWGLGLKNYDLTVKDGSDYDFAPLRTAGDELQTFLSTVYAITPTPRPTPPPLSPEVMQCYAGTLAQYMNSVIDKTEALGLTHVRLLSPAFNMTSYTYQPIVSGMVSEGAKFSKLYGIAGNVYNDGGQTITHFLDQDWAAVPSIASYRLFITETGMVSGTLDDLKNEMNKLKTVSPYKDRVNSALLFNAFNSNSGWAQFALSDSQIRTVCNGGPCGIVGVNSASGFSQGDSYYSRAQGLSMGFNLEIASGANDLGETVNGVQKAHAKGLSTIIRICVGDVCGFGGSDGPTKYANFLKQVDNSVSYPVYAIVGPNEPDAENWVSLSCTP